jgi:hypothetical protein
MSAGIRPCWSSLGSICERVFTSEFQETLGIVADDNNFRNAAGMKANM